MADRRLSPRGRYIPVIFAIADVVLVNLLFALVCGLYPQIRAAGDLRLLWVLANVSTLPVLWCSMKRGMQRAMLLDVVARQAISDTGLHALFFLASISLMRIGDMPMR
ncbi:MAG: hypothetical protein K2F77_08940, partial [Muribaculaceae bacterium]|nr:hypothetical protein [Muribaculaceae bacterium]